MKKADYIKAYQSTFNELATLIFQTEDDQTMKEAYEAYKTLRRLLPKMAEKECLL